MEETISWTQNTEWNPIWRMAHVSAVLGRSIILINGYAVRVMPGNEQEQQDGNNRQVIVFDHGIVTLYDTVRGNWKVVQCTIDAASLARLSFDPRCLHTSGCAVATVGEDQVYIFGGFCLSEGNNVNCLSRIDFSLSPPVWKAQSGGITREEEVIAEMQPRNPSPRDKCSMVHWQNKLVLFGGFGHDFRISPEEGRYDYVGPLLDDHGEWKIHEWGRGWNNQVLVYNLSTCRWSNPATTGSGPSPRAAHGSCSQDNIMFVFGGRSNGGDATIRLNDLYSLDIHLLEWTCINLTPKSQCPLPIGRSWMTLTSLDNGCLLVVGGLNSNDEPLSDAHVINPWTNKMVARVYPGTDFVDGGSRLWHTANYAFDGMVYTIGGCASNILNGDTQVQLIVDRYHVIYPTSLYRQCLRVAACFELSDPALPGNILHDLNQISGG